MEFSKRLWGWYFTLYSGKHFKVKLLFFKKGLGCSMQRHFKRNELWCFIFGTGNMFTRYGAVSSNYIISGGEFQNVRVGVWHKFLAKNRTLVLEIQTGICEEDDIERVN